MATDARTTYTETAIQKRSIGDVINFIDWTEAPLLKKLGTDNQNKFRLQNWPRTKYEWIEDEMALRSTTTTEAIDATSETDVDVTTGTGVLFKEGDIVKVESELMYVVSVATDTLTVVRGFGGTTAAAHDTAKTLERVTIARLEGADYDTGYTTVTSQPYNYTQIISEAIKVTGSEQVDAKYGVTDTMAFHLSKLMGGSNGIGEKFRAGTLPILLENTFWHGKRALGTASAARAMGGFEQFVTTNVTNLSSAAVTRKSIEDLLTTIFLAGGNPDTLICGAHVRRKITSFYEGLITTARSESRGGSSITNIVTDFGELEVMWHKRCPADRIYLVDSTKMGWITYRPWQVIDRPSTGDYSVKEVLGEFGFVLVNEKSHGYLYGASTTV